MEPEINDQEESNEEVAKSDEKRTIVDILFDGLVRVYDGFMHFVRWNDNDPIWLVVFKLITRATGIIIGIILSPFIIIGIIVSIMVVS